MAKEHGKIRGFFFEIEGDDETLQEGLKNFGAALGRGPQRVIKALPSAGSKGKDREEEIEVEEVEVEPNLLDGSDENGSTKKKKAASPRSPSAMPDVIQLDLTGSKGTSLKEFADQKKPTKLADRCLLATHWLKSFGDVPEVTPNHIFTCFKILDWTPHPSSYTTMLNDMKNKQKSLDKGTAPGSFRINLHGENMVAKMGAES